MTENEFDREFDLDAMMKAWDEDPEFQELMSKIGSDYDENGVPYWEKYE